MARFSDHITKHNQQGDYCRYQKQMQQVGRMVTPVQQDKQCAKNASDYRPNDSVDTRQKGVLDGGLHRNYCRDAGECRIAGKKLVQQQANKDCQCGFEVAHTDMQLWNFTDWASSFQSFKQLSV